MPYILHSVTLSKPQVASLLKGHTVRLSHSKLTGTVPVYFTSTQISRIQKAIQNKKGMDIKLSNSQLRHNLKHGSGFMDFVRGIGKHVIAPIASTAGEIILRAVGNAIGAAFNKKITSRIAGNGPHHQSGDGILDFVSGIFGGEAQPPVGVPPIKRIGRPRKMATTVHGNGFLSDLASSVGSVAKFAVKDVVAPIAAPVLQNILQKKLGGGRKRGNGINPPGY